MKTIVNDKGYTLVELLLSIAILGIIMAQVGRIMMSTTQLYLNGNMEVNLQTDAQQVIQMFEELAIDCDKSISFDGTSTITITNKPTSTYLNNYEIKLIKDAGKEYGDLWLVLKNTSNEIKSTQLMANNVAAINLEKNTFAENSRVVFTVKMQNDMYTYNSSKDIYLRNHIGDSDSGIGEGSSGTATSESVDVTYLDFEILRYKEYDFTVDLPTVYKEVYHLSSCKFKPVTYNDNYNPDDTENFPMFVDVGDSTNIGGYYQMTAQNKIKCLNTFNSDASGTGSNYIYLKSIDNDDFILRCYTKDIVVGMESDDGNVMSVPMDVCWSGAGNAIRVYVSGVSLESCTKFSFTPMMKFGGNLEALKDDTSNPYKYYSIYANNGNFVYPESEELTDVNLKGQLNGMLFYDEELVVPIGPEVSCTNPTEGVSYQPQDFKIYVGEGYPGPKLDKSDPENLAFIKSNLSNTNFKYTQQLIQTGINVKKLYVDKDDNALAFECDRMTWHQTQLSGNDIEKASKFYEAGGELYFDFNITFTDELATKSYKVKVVPSPVDGCNSNHTPKAMSTEAANALTDSMNSGIHPTNLTKSNEGGKTVYKIPTTE